MRARSSRRKFRFACSTAAAAAGKESGAESAHRALKCVYYDDEGGVLFFFCSYSRTNSSLFTCVSV